VHLIDYKDLVLAQLRWDARLFHQSLDMLHGVVGGSVKFKDVQGTLFVEGLTTLTRIAGFTLCRWVLTVDGLSEDACTSGLSHSAWATEQVGMSQLTTLDGVFQCCCQGCLSYDTVEGHWTVFPGRNDVFHKNIMNFSAKIQNN
jgi:hypothetical protein